MSVELQVLSALLDRFTEEVRQAKGDERTLQRLSLGLQKTLGLSAQEVADLTVEKSGWYIQKAAKDDPPPGPMTRLGLVDALRGVSVEVVESSDVRGLTLACLRCGAQWSPGYQGGDRTRPEKGFQWCPAGCNRSAIFNWDEGKEPSYNPMFGYR